MRMSYKFNQHDETSSKSKNFDISNTKGLKTNRNNNLFENQKLHLDSNISPNNNMANRGKNINFKGSATRVLELSLCSPEDKDNGTEQTNKIFE